MVGVRCTQDLLIGRESGDSAKAVTCRSRNLDQPLFQQLLCFDLSRTAVRVKVEGEEGLECNKPAKEEERRGDGAHRRSRSAEAAVQVREPPRSVPLTPVDTLQLKTALCSFLEALSVPTSAGEALSRPDLSMRRASPLTFNSSEARSRACRVAKPYAIATQVLSFPLAAYEHHQKCSEQVFRFLPLLKPKANGTSSSITPTKQNETI